MAFSSIKMFLKRDLAESETPVLQLGGQLGDLRKVTPAGLLVGCYVKGWYQEQPRLLRRGGGKIKNVRENV